MYTLVVQIKEGTTYQLSPDRKLRSNTVGIATSLKQAECFSNITFYRGTENICAKTKKGRAPATSAKFVITSSKLTFAARAKFL